VKTIRDGTNFDPRTSTEAISHWLKERRGQWFDAKTIREGVAEYYNVGFANPGISEGAVRYQLAQMIRTKEFEQQRLKCRVAGKRSLYEYRMKPEIIKPIGVTPWTIFADMF
jgi:hypothetical protein